MVHSETAVRSVTYVSRATSPLTQASLEALLVECRGNNERSGLTGMLAVRGDDFFQVVEGPDDAISALLDGLSRDARHTDMRVLNEETVPFRQFPDWRMRCERLDDYPVDEIPGFHAIGGGDDPAGSRTRGVLDLVRWLQLRATRALSERNSSAAS
ncbi:MULTISPECIES: BLUF domain-containing protein [Plantibacter]|uniref:BLUF domain-containing protein n=1 Tax=Plantibacter TaxID=190323 RepID=UPI00254D4D4A|nr:BLUF domain-containing protein [Plantibacter sp. lyk4-40-MEA-4]